MIVNALTWCKTRADMVRAAGMPHPIRWNNGDLDSSV
jgi:hypothetical protein